jgi:hypothetical protein
MHDTDQGGRDGQGGDLLQEKLREMKAARLHDRRKSRDASAYQDSQRGSQSSPAGPRRGGRDQELDTPGSADRRADRASGKQKLGVKATEDVRQILSLYSVCNTNVLRFPESFCFTK